MGRKKKERTDDVEVFWERKMLKRGQRVGGMICNLCRSAEEGGVGIARRSFIVIFYFQLIHLNLIFRGRKTFADLQS